MGAFNIENIDMAKAVIQAAEEMKMPAIIQTTFTTVNYLGEKVLRAAVKALAQAPRLCLPFILTTATVTIFA